jgi:hypothetical protein
MPNLQTLDGDESILLVNVPRTVKNISLMINTRWEADSSLILSFIGSPSLSNISSLDINIYQDICLKDATPTAPICLAYVTKFKFAMSGHVDKPASKVTALLHQLEIPNAETVSISLSVGSDSRIESLEKIKSWLECLARVNGRLRHLHMILYFNTQYFTQPELGEWAKNTWSTATIQETSQYQWYEIDCVMKE